jgi:hypothetical protein
VAWGRPNGFCESGRDLAAHVLGALLGAGGAHPRT